MIYIKTSLKKVPACCTKCKYSGTRFIRSLESMRFCRLTDTQVPMVKSGNGNMKYTKPKNCPLIDMGQEDS